MNHRVRRGVVVLAALGVATPACDDASDEGTERVRITIDDDLTDRLRALSDLGAGGELRSVTGFEWDHVHVFAEGATRDAIEAVTGEPVVRDDRYYDAGNLLVFELDGELVRAVSVVPDLLGVSQPTWTADVRLEPVGERPPVILRLSEP